MTKYLTEVCQTKKAPRTPSLPRSTGRNSQVFKRGDENVAQRDDLAKVFSVSECSRLGETMGSRGWCQWQAIHSRA